MRQKPQKVEARSDEAEKAVRDIRRATRRHYSAEDKIGTRDRRPARRGQHR